MMKPFHWPFGRKLSPEAIVLEGCIARLRLGIFYHLVREFISNHDQSDAELLSAAVVNMALVETPGNEVARAFRQEHIELIEAECSRLHTRPEIAKALSYLYAAQILYVAIATRTPVSEQSWQLSDKATTLSIDIADPKGALEGKIEEIAAFTAEFADGTKATWSA
jgi:hypothetical protein